MTVRIKQYISPLGEDCSAPPLPLNHGFSADRQYFVHGWVCEAGEYRAILVNDDGQVWPISNRHVRIVNRMHNDGCLMNRIQGAPGYVSEDQWAKFRIDKNERPSNIDPELWQMMKEQVEN